MAESSYGPGPSAASRPGPDPGVLGALAWPAVPPAPWVVVPVGSVEQHGPHLPLTTDTVIAVAVAAGVVSAVRPADRSPTTGVAGRGSVLLGPAVGYGASGEHQDFPGTTSIGTEALRVLVVELVRSLATWAGGVVLVNGHGGNAEALAGAVAQLRGEGRAVWLYGCASPGSDLHAGRTETSLLLHLAPELVRIEQARGGPVEPAEALLPRLRTDGVAAVSRNGVLGDPRGADAAEGRRLYEDMVDRIVTRLVSDADGALTRDPDGGHDGGRW